MSINYQGFKEELKNKTRSTFQGCLERLSIKEIAGFALYSDTSAMTISVSCNTFSHLKDLQKEEEGNDIYFKWSVGEWKYEMINSKEFNSLTTVLQEEASLAEGNQGKFVSNRNRVYNIAVEVLEELRKEGLFDRMHKDFVLMFGISDFSDPQMEIGFVKRLNPAKQADEFEDWLLSETESE